jgi:hypothetical protein
VVHRSHAPSRRVRAPQPAPASRSTGVLALQRMAGNRAVRALVARDKVVKIGSERVQVGTDEQQKDAERIITEMKAKFGVTFDSIAARATTHKRSSEGRSATEEALAALDAVPWKYDELQAVERALKHFGPVLGEQRKGSRLASTPQEIVTVGRLNTAPDEPETRGQYFPEAQTFALFNPGPDSPTDAKSLEQKATHEIAHGVFAPQLKAFMKMTGYWKVHSVRTGDKQAEGPPDGYADKNAAEDLAQSVMYFFTDPERLKKGGGRPKGTWGNPCPKRYEFIRKIVGGWTPKRKR